MKTYSFQPWSVVLKICGAPLYPPSRSPSLCGYLVCLKSTLETLANKFWDAACVIPTLLHLREQNKGSEMPPEPSTASPLNWALSWRGRAGNGQWVLSTCSTPGTPPRHKIAFSLQKGMISRVAAGSPHGHHARREFFPLIWLLITTLLGTAPLKSTQPISIQTMKWKPKNAESNRSAGPG